MHFFCFENQQQQLYLVCRVEVVVWDESWQIRVINGAERQTVIPAAAEVCDLNILPENTLDEDTI